MTEVQIQTALKNAVSNMEYEKMFSVIRKIISLRIHLPEDDILENSMLEELYKKTFALEQDVKIEEVYDPEVFNGVTDTQLATMNLVNDLQKAFCIEFDTEVLDTIKTVKDLVQVFMLQNM